MTACEAARIGDRIVLDPDENEVAASDGKVFLAQMSSLDRYAKTEILEGGARTTRRARWTCARRGVKGSMRRFERCFETRRRETTMRVRD